MSCVFLTDRHAYKLKKPVRYPFLDFSTLEARRRDCDEEIRLNRRLARDVYLGVVPLTLGRRNRLQLDGDGETVEWLVKMRRLPRRLMLDEAILGGKVTEEDIQRVARVLIDFYRHSHAVPLRPEDYRERFKRDIRANRLELSDPEYGLGSDELESMTEIQLRFLDKDARTFDRRVTEGRIIEAHGDLRPDHVCLAPQPLFIDCLEFNREFRILDPVDELSYLAIECENAGASFVGEVALETYCESLNDHPPAALIHFYRTYRAILRAKLSIWHLRDHDSSEPGRWLERARDYLRLACRYAGMI